MSDRSSSNGSDDGSDCVIVESASKKLKSDWAFNQELYEREKTRLLRNRAFFNWQQDFENKMRNTKQFEKEHLQEAFDNIVALRYRTDSESEPESETPGCAETLLDTQECSDHPDWSSFMAYEKTRRLQLMKLQRQEETKKREAESVQAKDTLLRQSIRRAMFEAEALYTVQAVVRRWEELELKRNGVQFWKRGPERKARENEMQQMGGLSEKWSESFFHQRLKG